MIGRKIFIDWEDTGKEGATAAYLGKGGNIEIKTARDSRGERPWTSYKALRPRLTFGGVASP